MTDVMSLWLPILISGVVVFIVSALVWMVMPHHKADVQYCPQQDKLLDAIRDIGIKPGNYMFPNCEDPKDWKSEEVQKVFNAGPWGTLNLWDAKPNMGKNMLLTLLSFIVVSIFVAYITGEARAPGADFAAVFQIAASVSAVCYVFGGAANAIWFGKRLRFFLTDAIDGVVYSVITGAIFGLMWPSLETATPALP